MKTNKLLKLLKAGRLITLSKLTKSPGVLLKYALLSLSGNREGVVTINNVKLPAWVVSRLIDAVNKGYSVSINNGVVVDGIELPLHDSCELGMVLNALLNDFKRLSNGNWITNTTVGTVVFRHVTFSVVEVFKFRLYDFDTPHKTGDWIIDIGANVGDSAIWFAKQGFRVLAVEPVPSAYEEMLRNLMLNDVVDKVKAIHAAYNSSNREVRVNDYDCLESTVTAHVDNNGVVNVRGFDLRTLLEFTDWGAKVLKVDCEGCEGEIINDPFLLWFSHIFIEAPGKHVHNALVNMGYRLVKVNKHPSNPLASIHHYAKP